MYNPFADRDKESDPNWFVSLDKIEDTTRRNYFSSLPQEEALKQHFSEAFVINQPKGSVGGDGFWFHQHGDDVYLALFTCIGEGHLASMMIRIYMSALKKMVEGYSIDFPGSILQFLHREVQARFKDKNNILLNTNANVGIVKLNTITKQMEFAGANMDLIQIKEDQYHLVKGEKHQVGENTNKRLTYSSNSVKHTTESNFFLCSTGVFNLIGGDNLTNLTMNQLGDFFTNQEGETLAAQKLTLRNYLKNWTGANRQNDDILIIGFKP